MAQTSEQAAMNNVVSNQNVGAPGRLPTPFLSEKRCAYCATRLDVHQAVREGICAAAVCRRKRDIKLAAQQRRVEVADSQRAAADFRARVAPSLGVADPQSLTLAIVPNFQRKVLKTPRSRRMEFRAHLIRVVRQAFEEKLDTWSVSTLAEELDRTVREQIPFPEAAAGCATCRGHCCRTAGTHAYLDATTMRAYLARHPGLRWREVVRAFMEQLPDATFDYSCVYHGRHGCALPREMRASLCNQFYCGGLKELRDAIAVSGPTPVLVVAIDGGKVRRSTLIQADGTQVRVQKVRSTQS